MTNRTLAGTLRGLGAVLVLAGVLATYASRVLFDEEAFGRRVAASLEDDRVADLVADQLTTALVLERPEAQVVVAGVDRWLGGHGGPILVRGDRGVGKRTLIRQVLASIGDRGRAR